MKAGKHGNFFDPIAILNSGKIRGGKTPSPHQFIR
jgi:hypothetical protein